ncbi:MAG: 6-phosphogluconolactonase [Pseudomonadota bacterium]
MNLVVVDDPQAVAHEAAGRVRRAAELAQAARGSFNVALAGGSTPRRLYARLASDTGTAGTAAIDWNRVHIFFGDERCVPPQHPDSNFGMVKATLLDRIAIPAAQVHRMRGEEPSPVAAAAAYQAELRRPLDLAILGMGTDGHTASLFPGGRTLGDGAAGACAAVEVPSLGTTRLTLTNTVWLEARDILFLVTGTEKAPVLNDIAFGAPRPAELPAQVIARRSGPVTILCDRAAAALFSAS